MNNNTLNQSNVREDMTENDVVEETTINSDIFEDDSHDDDLLLDDDYEDDNLKNKKKKKTTDCWRYHKICYYIYCSHCLLLFFLYAT